MSECVRCGYQMPPDARFCIKCGMAASEGATSVVSGRFDTTETTPVKLLDALREATLGEYEILTELGRGGMAVVYLAQDLALDRKVAIKVMSPELRLMGDQVVKRFNREARTAAKLSHPHVIPIYAVKETPELTYFVMKFIQGRSLESVMRGEDRLPTGVVQTILSQVGSALDYAHRNGVVHRDIKPGNVMLDEEGWAVVTDFGIAKALEAEGLTLTGAAIGTPTYMSPEQCSGLTVTGAADQYSLGVLAYEMLSGKLPFEGESAMTVMYRHTHEPPPHITEAWPDCPPALGAAVMRMLAKKPADRWPSVEAATSAIAAVQPLADSSVRTQMVTMVKRASNQSLLAQFRTPRTPVPSTAGRVASQSAPAEASAAGEITPDTSPVAAAGRPEDRAAPRRSRGWLLAVPVIGAAAAAGWLLLPGDDTPPAPTPPVTEPGPSTPSSPIASLAVTPGASTLEVGDTASLVAVARDSAGEPLGDAEIAWSTSAPAVARVEPDGTVTGRAPGFAQVTARAEGHSATVGITVTSPTPPATPAVEDTPPAVAAVTAAPNPATVLVGELVTLQATAVDDGGRPLADRPAAWRSSDPAVATVSAGGEVRGLRPGRVDIIATIEGRTARVPLTVTPVPVASIRLTPNTVALQVGETAQLTAATLDADGSVLSGRTVQWRVAGAAVQVSSTGQITAVAPGSATVTATSESRRATATITVSAAPERPEPRPAPPDEATDHEQVTAAVTAYGRALESRDLNQLRRAYPGLTDEQAAAWKTFFENVSDLHVTLSITSIRIDGDVATAVVDAVQEFRTNRSERRSSPFTATLERVPGGWRLTEVH